MEKIFLKYKLPQTCVSFESGFTLVELLITLVILTIIFLIAFARFPREATYGLDVESSAHQVAGDLRLAAKLSQSYNQRYDVEFYGSGGATSSPYKTYRIKNYNTGEYYKEETYTISSNVTCSPLGTGADAVQIVAFYSEGYSRLLTSAGNPITDTTKNGLSFSSVERGMSSAIVRIVIETAAVTVAIIRSGQQIY